MNYKPSAISLVDRCTLPAISGGKLGPSREKSNLKTGVFLPNGDGTITLKIAVNVRFPKNPPDHVVEKSQSEWPTIRIQRIRHILQGTTSMLRYFHCLVLAAAITCGWAGSSNAQILQRAVGGVSIDAAGQIGSISKVEQQSVIKELRSRIGEAPEDLESFVDMRMISIKGLVEQIAQSNTKGVALSDEVRYLAGLQRIEYVFVYPESNDIVLAGPAEGWKLANDGTVVGVTTGKPVVMLDDLLVALRTVERAATEGITCSIDPTAEGRQALEAFIKKQTVFSRRVVKGVKNALGLQQVTLTGVPQDSHFASVLVASDYRMKRFAMNLENAPIAGMPGFIDLLKKNGGGLDNMMPRWWMACDYDSIARTDDGLAWQIRGQGVKVMTEDEIVSASGNVKGSGKANPLAEAWANTMTEKYDELSAKTPIFGQLRNIMDLSVVAALIEKEDLCGKSGCDLSTLQDASTVAIEKWQTPKSVATESSFVKKGREYIITASGGVEVDSWKVADNTEVVSAINAKRDAAGSADGWRW